LVRGKPKKGASVFSSFLGRGPGEGAHKVGKGGPRRVERLGPPRKGRVAGGGGIRRLPPAEDRPRRGGEGAGEGGPKGQIHPGSEGVWWGGRGGDRGAGGGP